MQELQLTSSFKVSSVPSVVRSRILKVAITALFLLPQRNKISTMLLTKALKNYKNTVTEGKTIKY